MFLRLAMFVFTLALSAAVWAGFDEGLVAARNGDYETALKEWQPLAEQGDASAQQNLGIMYEHGDGVPINMEEAVKWFRKAAEQGDASGQLYLGDMYSKGQGVQKNEEEAVKWWRKAAEQGSAKGMGAVGWYTALGLGVEKNLVEGERLLKLAVSKGDYISKLNLKVVQETRACLKKSSTVIFGETLNCTSKDELRNALKNGGLTAVREDNNYLYDLYDSSAALEGSRGLAVAYINEKFAIADYNFNSGMDAAKVVEVRNMVSGKYGKPSSSIGDQSVGEVTYTWQLKDGIKVEVSRGWPDTTVHLKYVHPVNFTAMKAEKERQKQAEAAEKHSKQNRAF